VDIAAPGENIFTTMSANGSIGNNGAPDYDFTQGTSFSAPYVSGIAALIKSRFPDAAYQDIKGRLMASVNPLASTGKLATGGAVNAAMALQVAPSPVLVIRSVSVSETTGNGNGLPDPDETLNLNIALENVWQGAAGISAVLSSADINVIIQSPVADYPDIATDAYAAPLAPFSVSLGSRAGHHRIPFTLEITAAGYTVTRHFELEAGTLANNVTYHETLQQHDQDDVQIFHVDVPAGATSLQITTTAAEDIDLIVRPGRIPEFVFSPDGIVTDPADTPPTLIGRSITGNENITVANPQAGTWHIVIINFSGVPNVNYTVQASYQGGISNNPPQPSVPDIVTPVNTAATSQISHGDVDVGDVHTYTLAQPPLHGQAGVDANGLVSYVPDPDYTGTDTVGITVTDLSGAVAMIVIPVLIDADTDGDGVPDAQDAFPSDPAYSLDSDGDGMPDLWEQQYGLNAADTNDAALDADGDGASNLAEFIAGTDPMIADMISHTYSLTEGWNIVSFPMDLGATDLTDIYAAVPELESIWSYVNGGWQSYIPGVAFLNSLTTITADKGYWIRLPAGVTKQVSFSGPPSQAAVPNPVAGSGWNLIGLTTPVTDIGTYLTNNGGVSVWTFANGSWKSFVAGTPPFLNSLQQMDVGAGYYVDMK
jgi:hypothetical protein